jgi:hypothetical protein
MWGLKSSADLMGKDFTTYAQLLHAMPICSRQHAAFRGKYLNYNNDTYVTPPDHGEDLETTVEEVMGFLGRYPSPGQPSGYSLADLLTLKFVEEVCRDGSRRVWTKLIIRVDSDEWISWSGRFDRG